MSDQHYYYLLDGKEQGPFSRAAVDRLVREGKVHGAVFRTGPEHPWQTGEEIGLIAKAPPKVSNAPLNAPSDPAALVFRADRAVKRPGSSGPIFAVVLFLALLIAGGVWLKTNREAKQETSKPSLVSQTDQPPNSTKNTASVRLEQLATGRWKLDSHEINFGRVLEVPSTEPSNGLHVYNSDGQLVDGGGSSALRRMSHGGDDCYLAIDTAIASGIGAIRMFQGACKATTGYKAVDDPNGSSSDQIEAGQIYWLVEAPHFGYRHKIAEVRDISAGGINGSDHDAASATSPAPASASVADSGVSSSVSAASTDSKAESTTAAVPISDETSGEGYRRFNDVGEVLTSIKDGAPGLLTAGEIAAGECSCKIFGNRLEINSSTSIFLYQEATGPSLVVRYDEDNHGNPSSKFFRMAEANWQDVGAQVMPGYTGKYDDYLQATPDGVIKYQGEGKPQLKYVYSHGRFVLAIPPGHAASADAGPIPIFTPSPHYPPEEQNSGTTGRVTLMLEISPAGDVTNVVVEKTSRNGNLDRAAVEIAKTWKYKPMRVRQFARVPIDFNL